MLRQLSIVLLLGVFSLATVNSYAIQFNADEPVYDEEVSGSGSSGSSDRPRKPISGPVTPSEQGK